MDPLNQGKRVLMRTIQGQPPVEVVWFRVDPNVYGMDDGWSVFGTRNWEPDNSNDGIGEQEEPVPDGCRRKIRYYNGAQPYPIVPSPQPCGSREVSERGAILGVDPVFWTNHWGQAPCCPGFRLGWDWMGGEESGGSWRVKRSRSIRWTGGEEAGGSWPVMPPRLEWRGGEECGGTWPVYAPGSTAWRGGEECGGSWPVTLGRAVAWTGGEEAGGSWPVEILPPTAWRGGEECGGSWPVTIGRAVAWGGGEEAGGSWPVEHGGGMPLFPPAGTVLHFVFSAGESGDTGPWQIASGGGWCNGFTCSDTLYLSPAYDDAYSPPWGCRLVYGLTQVECVYESGTGGGAHGTVTFSVPAGIQCIDYLETVVFSW
jgi:hypothetical protein